MIQEKSNIADLVNLKSEETNRYCSNCQLCQSCSFRCTSYGERRTAKAGES